jgi:hypothetical protein
MLRARGQGTHRGLSKTKHGQCYEPFRVGGGQMGRVPCCGAAASLTRAGSSSRLTPVRGGGVV